MTALRVPRIAAWVGTVFWLGSGVWAFLAPHSFYEQIAPFEPYNRHFLHDVGAFAIGLGAVLALALLTRWSALRVALAGVGVGSVFHVISHAVDSDLGGRSTDVPGLIVVALVFLIGAATPDRERVEVQ
jgi:hypothetical protein